MSPAYTKAFILTLLLCSIGLQHCAPPSQTTEPQEEANIAKEKQEQQDAGGGVEERTEHTVKRVKIVHIEGDGSLKKIQRPSNRKLPRLLLEAERRFRTTLLLRGTGLQHIERVTLKVADSDQCDDEKKPCVFYPKDGLLLDPSTTKEGTMQQRRLRLPIQIFSALFLLMGTINGQSQVLAQVFLLQGEPGPAGKKGDTGSSCEVQQVGSRLTFACSPAAKSTSTANVTMMSVAQADYLTKLEQNLRVTSTSISIGYDPKKPALTVSRDRVTVSHANFHVESGEGKTNAGVNGKGNVIIGYNEQDATSSLSRVGSHNLVVGGQHTYSSYGGVVFGDQNKITAPYACVLGGDFNLASGQKSTVLGGPNNKATGLYSIVSGGASNTSSGNASTISGGSKNSVTGPFSHISGGMNNQVAAEQSSLLGGRLGKIPSGKSYYCSPACGKPRP